jgi:nucleoside-diphosphate-sugar epimerase
MKTELTLVTGACGYIGAHLLRQLLGAGDRVRAMVRDPARLPAEFRGAVEVVTGDIRDVRAVRTAVREAGVVLHLAACACAWRPDPGEFFSINEGGTGLLLNEALAAGVRRLVHVSTILAAPPFRAAPLRGRAARLTPYEESKMAAEQLVGNAAGSGLDAVIVRPTRVYGPGPNTEANAVTRLIELHLAGRFRARLADGGVLANYVHAADVATGIRLATRRGRRGAAYVLGGGENVTVAALLETAGALAGVRRMTVAVPARLGVAVGHAAELWGRMGGRPGLTSAWVRTFLEDRRADITTSRNELGYEPRPLRDGLRETIAWLRERKAA